MRIIHLNGEATSVLLSALGGDEYNRVIGVEPPVDPKNPTRAEICNIHLNGQATSVLLSALDDDEYNRVMGVDVAKQIWDTLDLAHEGLTK